MAGTPRLSFLGTAIATRPVLGLLLRTAGCTCASRDLQQQFPSSNLTTVRNFTLCTTTSSRKTINNISMHHTTVATGECVAHGNGGGEGSRRSLFFPRRAVMYVPASDKKKVQKTTTISVDSVIFDIEDGVAVSQKDIARKSIGAAIATSRRSDSASALSEHVVRVNGVDSGLMNSDLREVFRSCDSHVMSPDAIMLPKVESAEHVAELDLCLSFYRPSLPPLPLYIMTESPHGLLNLPQICQFATCNARRLRLCSVVFGSDDYLASIGGVRSDSRSPELAAVREMIVGVASAYGVSPIDMVSTNFTDLTALREEAEEGANMGFTGKQVIHPAQVTVVQKAFSPSEERVKWATGLITAFSHHQEHGQGAFVYEGHMIDRPLLLQAQNIVSLHDNVNRTTNN